MSDRPPRPARRWARALFLATLATPLVAGGGSPAYAAVEDTQPPTAPGPITVVEATQTSVLLTWAASTDDVGVTGYEVTQLSRSPSRDNVLLQRYEVVLVTPGGNTVVATVGLLPPIIPSTSAVVSRLSPGTTYTFAVRAVDEAGNRSALSPSVTVTTRGGPPPGCTASYDVSSWPGGMLVHVTVRNTGSTALDAWVFGWTLPAGEQLYSVWGAELVARTGDRVTVRNPSYHPALAPGAAVIISYVASGSTAPSGPVLNDLTCSVG